MRRPVTPRPKRLGQLAGQQLEGLAFNANRIPVCPVCGEEPTARVPNNLHGGTFVVRVPCQHQLEALDRQEDLRKGLEEVGRFRTKNRAFMPTRPHEGTRLADIDLARTPTAEPGLGAARIFLRTWEARAAEGSVLGLVGDGGTGKTLILSALCQELEARGVTTLLLTAPGLVDRARRHEGSISDLTTQVGFLVLDDLGTEHMSAQAYEVLFQVFDARGAAVKPWAWTSNLTTRDLLARWARQLEGPPSRYPAHEAQVAARRLISRLGEKTSIKTLEGRDSRLANRVDWLKQEEEGMAP